MKQLHQKVSIICPSYWLWPNNGVDSDLGHDGCSFWELWFSGFVRFQISGFPVTTKLAVWCQEPRTLTTQSWRAKFLVFHGPKKCMCCWICVLFSFVGKHQKKMYQWYSFGPWTKIGTNRVRIFFLTIRTLPILMAWRFSFWKFCFVGLAYFQISSRCRRQWWTTPRSQTHPRPFSQHIQGSNAS